MVAELPADDLGIGAGLDHQVEFEPLVVAVVEEVDARIELGVAHPAVTGETEPPVGGVGAVQEIDRAGQGRLSGQLRPRVGPLEPPAQHGAWRRRVVAGQCRDGCVRRQEQPVAGSLGEVGDALMGLAGVGDEA